MAVGKNKIIEMNTDNYKNNSILEEAREDFETSLEYAIRRMITTKQEKVTITLKMEVVLDERSFADNKGIVDVEDITYKTIVNIPFKRSVKRVLKEERYIKADSVSGKLKIADTSEQLMLFD